MMLWAKSRNLLDINHEDTYADEVAGYSVRSVAHSCVPAVRGGGSCVTTVR